MIFKFSLKLPRWTIFKAARLRIVKPQSKDHRLTAVTSFPAYRETEIVAAYFIVKLAV